MKSLAVVLFALFALLALTLAASAQLGLTESQLLAKYGQPLKTEPVTAGTRFVFDKGDVRVMAVLHKGTVHFMYYRRDRAFEPRECEAILESNGPGWERDARNTWRTPGLARMAVLGADGTFIVTVTSFVFEWDKASMDALRKL